MHGLHEVMTHDWPRFGAKRPRARGVLPRNSLLDRTAPSEVPSVHRWEVKRKSERLLYKSVAGPNCVTLRCNTILTDSAAEQSSGSSMRSRCTLSFSSTWARAFPGSFDHELRFCTCRDTSWTWGPLKQESDVQCDIAAALESSAVEASAHGTSTRLATVELTRATKTGTSHSGLPSGALSPGPTRSASL